MTLEYKERLRYIVQSNRFLRSCCVFGDVETPEPCTKKKPNSVNNGISKEARSAC